MKAWHKCSVCGETKPANQFYRRLGGHQSRCIVCDNAGRSGRLPEALAVGVRHRVSDGSGMTHEEIGQVLGVTRQRVEQIERSALAKLRKALRRAGVSF